MSFFLYSLTSITLEQKIEDQKNKKIIMSDFNNNTQLPSATPVVVTNQPLPSDQCLYGPLPQRVICNLCRNEVLTETEKVNGSRVWAWCCILFFVTGVCCCVPCCMDSCKDTHHKCPTCDKTIGQETQPPF